MTATAQFCRIFGSLTRAGVPIQFKPCAQVFESGCHWEQTDVDGDLKVFDQSDEPPATLVIAILVFPMTIL